MNKFNKQKKKDQGQAMIIVVVFLVIISVSMIFAISAPMISHLKVSSLLFSSIKSFHYAEVGLEDSFYRVNKGWNIEEDEVFVLDDITITMNFESDGDRLDVFSEAKTSDVIIRRLRSEFILGEGSAFNYGAQAGEYGFEISGGSTIIGNIYSNGDIVGINGVITGSATAADMSLIKGESGPQHLEIGIEGGDAWAYEINNTDTHGEIYCQIGSGNTGKECDNSREDPPPREFPISDHQISVMKQEVEEGDVIQGDHSIGSSGDTLGLTKITGNLSIGSRGTLTLLDTVWVEGDITISGGGKVHIDESLGNESVVLISDGKVSISGGGEFRGSGEPGSYPVLISTSTCPDGDGCGGNEAIYISGGAGAVVLFAPNGLIRMQGGSAARSITGKGVRVSGGGEVEYDSGLADLNFKSGPSGGFQILSWNEVE